MINLINLTGFDIWLVVKVLFLLALFLYLGFALIVVRQVRLMRHVLTGILETPLTIISLLHLAFSLFIFFLALIIL